MTMIDITNLDKLTPEQKNQFTALLDQFPHLGSIMESARELNTPSKMEDTTKYIQPPMEMAEEMDYSSFLPSSDDVKSTPNRDSIPTMKVNYETSPFRSLEQPEEQKPLTKAEEEVRKDQRQKQRVQAAVAAGQPLEIAKFSPTGKTHPVLQKLRATVGLRSVREPVVVNLGGCNYSLRPLDRSHITQATMLAATTTSNSLLYQTNLEVAIVAYSVVAIDGVPTVDIFSIPMEEYVPEEERSTPMNELRREEKAAEALYAELLSSPNELVEGLGIYYQQEFPPLNLMGSGKAKFLCPAPQCLQSRITDSDADCFCPVHGEKMAREDQLPNPF